MYYAVIVPDGDTTALSYFSNNRKEALKELRKHPTSTLLMFDTAEALVRYMNQLHGDESTADPPAAIAGPSNVKHSADSENRRMLKLAIELNDVPRFLELVNQHRKLLITSENAPTIYNSNRENALHIAARRGQVKMCEIILETIRNPTYIEWVHNCTLSNADLIAVTLLSTFLNSPNRQLRETPLHIAAKRGFVATVSLLIAYPQCLYRANKHGFLPRQVIAELVPPCIDRAMLRRVIGGLLDYNYFVPMYRYANGQSPTVGLPFARDNAPQLHPSLGGPGPVIRYVKALAGPMKETQAQNFYKQWLDRPQLRIVIPVPPNIVLYWHCPIAKRHYRKTVCETEGNAGIFRQTELDNFIERVGRSLAEKFNVGWSEYWSFLQMMCDITDAVSLKRLEYFLSRQTGLLTTQDGEPIHTVGKCFGDLENIDVLGALSMVLIDQQQYPCIFSWRKTMCERFSSTLLNELIVLE